MNLPPDLAANLTPMPDDFAPSIQEMDSGLFVWRELLRDPDERAVVLEYAIRGADKLPEMRAEIWQAMELVRLGRLEFVKHMRPERHRRTPTMISTPTM